MESKSVMKRKAVQMGRPVACSTCGKYLNAYCSNSYHINNTGDINRELINYMTDLESQLSEAKERLQSMQDSLDKLYANNQNLSAEVERLQARLKMKKNSSTGFKRGGVRWET